MVGVCPRGAQVRALGGRRLCPASSSTTIHAPVVAAGLVPSPRSRRATRRSSGRRVRRRAGRGPGGCSPGGAADTTYRAGCSGCGTAGRSAGSPGPGSSAGPASRARPGRGPVRRPATSTGSTPAANRSAACVRTASRRARPCAVSPPPSATSRSVLRSRRHCRGRRPRRRRRRPPCPPGLGRRPGFGDGALPVAGTPSGTWTRIPSRGSGGAAGQDARADLM